MVGEDLPLRIQIPTDATILWIETGEDGVSVGYRDAAGNTVFREAPFSCGISYATQPLPLISPR